jgi:hypothetical protein
MSRHLDVEEQAFLRAGRHRADVAGRHRPDGYSLRTDGAISRGVDHALASVVVVELDVKRRLPSQAARWVLGKVYAVEVVDTVQGLARTFRYSALGTYSELVLYHPKYLA